MRKINDFGKKIGGAKKDLWNERGFLSEDVDSLNEEEKKEYINKKNVWKLPDYKKLFD